TNEIDKLVEKQNNITNKLKKCLQCFISNIDNKKRNCPNCNTKLPTLTSINQASSNQASSFQQPLVSEDTNKTIIFKPYEFKELSESSIK
ncbi:19663_t:CDS:1, partial [Racocetra persica]